MGAGTPVSPSHGFGFNGALCYSGGRGCAAGLANYPVSLRRGKMAVFQCARALFGQRQFFDGILGIARRFFGHDARDAACHGRTWARI